MFCFVPYAIAVSFALSSVVYPGADVLCFFIALAFTILGAAVFVLEVIDRSRV